LVVATGDGDSDVRNAVWQALPQIDKEWPQNSLAPQGVPGLVGRMTTTDEGVRGSAVKALGLIRSAADDHVKALVARLGNGEAVVRQAAAAVLGTTGAGATAAIPALVTALADSDDSIHQTIQQALTQIDPNWQHNPLTRQGIPTLIGKLGNSEWRVRQVAAISLGKCGPAARYALAKLTQLTTIDSDSDVRNAATAALRAIQA
jgi:HEAT repeat protein